MKYVELEFNAEEFRNLNLSQIQLEQIEGAGCDNDGPASSIRALHHFCNRVISTNALKYQFHQYYYE